MKHGLGRRSVVATGERADWREVRASTRDLVDPFYVALNAERCRARFGSEPDQQPSKT